MNKKIAETKYILASNTSLYVVYQHALFMCMNKPPPADFCVSGEAELMLLVMYSHWFIMAARKFHITCRNRLTFDYCLCNFIKDPCDGLVNLVVQLQIPQEFFFTAADFWLDLPTKQNVNHCKNKSKSELKKFVETKFKIFGSKVVFYCVEWETVGSLWSKQISARRFLAFHSEKFIIWPLVF